MTDNDPRRKLPTRIIININAYKRHPLAEKLAAILKKNSKSAKLRQNNIIFFNKRRRKYEIQSYQYQ